MGITQLLLLINTCFRRFFLQVFLSKIPDIVILNSVSGNQFLEVNSNMNAVIFNDGTVNIIYDVASLKTRCRMARFIF
jgi:hypothetical protein